MAAWRKLELLGLALFAVAVAAGCFREDAAALERGRAAEARGEWNEAKRQYAEAIALGNGEGFRRLAELMVKHDAADLFSKDEGGRDAQWIVAAERLAGQIRHAAKEAAERGCPVEGIQETLDGYAGAILTAREATRQTAAVEKRTEVLRQADARRMAALKDVQERKARLESDFRSLTTEVAALERQVEESERELEAERLRAVREADRLDSELGRLTAMTMDAEKSAIRYGGDPQQYWMGASSPFDAGVELGARTSLQKEQAADRDRKLSEEKAQLEARLAERRKERDALKEQIAECETKIEGLSKN